MPTKQPEGKLKRVGVTVGFSYGIVLNGVAEGRCIFEPIIFAVMLTGTPPVVVYIKNSPSVIIVLAGISGGLGVVKAGLKGKVSFVSSPPPNASGPLVCSKKLEEYDNDARLVMVMVMTLPAMAVIVPLMLSVPE